MKLRNELINYIELELSNKDIATILDNDGYKEDDIIKELKHESSNTEEGATTKELFLEYSLNQLRETIESNNKFYKDINKHDIISHLGHIQNAYVKASNENYRMKKYIEELEKDKGNLQIKLELCRHCSNCVECKDMSCINNIWHKSESKLL